MKAAEKPIHIDDHRWRSELDVASPDSIAATTPTKRLVRKRVGWLVALVALVGTAGSAWWVGSNTQSPDQAAARAAEPESSWITVPVEFRVLSSTLVTRGDIRPDARTEVRVPVSVEGDPVLTQAVVSASDVVDEGDRVVEVSGRPVFVLQGDVPVYRSLRPPMTGDDVTAVQESLVRLGYSIADDEVGTFGATTMVAIDAFYDAAGYKTVPTSETYPADLAIAERAVGDAGAALAIAQTALDNAANGPPGSEIAQADENVAAAARTLEVAQANVITDVALAHGSVDIAVANRTGIENNPEATSDEWNTANIAVSVADVALSDVIRDTSDAVEAAQAAVNIAVLARQELDATVDATELQTAVDAATIGRDDAVGALAELNRVNGPTIPQGEIVFVTTTPSRVLSAATSLDMSNAGAGGLSDPASSGGSAESLVSLASGGLVVTATISPDSMGLVSVGLEVEVLDELSDTAYPAEVSAVADAAATESDGQLGHQIIVTPAEDLPDGLAGSNVRVTMTAASTGTEQLVVPLAAVSSAADGSTRVSILDPSTDEPVEVEVTAGLSADGFVAIEPKDPSALSADSSVIIGR